VQTEQSYRLSLPQRVERISSLLKGIGVLMGGAKQALHYTDVVPAVILILAMKGGNNPLQYVIQADSQGLPIVNTEAVQEIFRVWDDQMLSGLYVGWTHGFHDGQRQRLEETLNQIGPTRGYILDHPREILQRVASDFNEAHAAWLA
jgi:CRISPR-associated protein Cst2